MSISNLDIPYMLLDLDYSKSGVGQSRRSENSITESQNVFPDEVF